MESKELMQKIVNILEDKKAQRAESFYMEKKTILADYYIVCSGTSNTHIRALGNEVEDEMEKEGIRVMHKAGYASARWVLLDYGTVIVHILHEIERENYDLETLFEKGHEENRK